MKTFFTVLMVILTFHGITNSQVTQQWAKRYNGWTGFEEAKKVVVDPFTEDVYVTGTSAGNIVTIKYNSAGSQKWIRTYDHNRNIDHPSDMIFDGLGNIIITGTSYVNDANSEIVTIKYDGNGTRLWAKTFGGNALKKDEGAALTTDIQGNVFVTGYCTNQINLKVSEDLVVMKYNFDGGLEWVQFYNGDMSISDKGLSITSDGNDVYAVGQ